MFLDLISNIFVFWWCILRTIWSFCWGTGLGDKEIKVVCRPGCLWFKVWSSLLRWRSTVSFLLSLFILVFCCCRSVSLLWFWSHGLRWCFRWLVRTFVCAWRTGGERWGQEALRLRGRGEFEGLVCIFGCSSDTNDSILTLPDFGDGGCTWTYSSRRSIFRRLYWSFCV